MGFIHEMGILCYLEIGGTTLSQLILQLWTEELVGSFDGGNAVKFHVR